jgi:hypothetical protein
LEDRTVPSSYSVANAQELIVALGAANLTPEADIITLAAGKTFILAAVNNTTDGATGLPVIASGEDLTIVGNGDTIERSTAAGTPAFRHFDVAAGASLTLLDLTLQGGLAFGSGTSALGGAIYSQGALEINGGRVQDNIAQGNAGGGYAAGGGIYSSGSLTLAGNAIIDHNQVHGGNGRPGGNAVGGGVFVGGGTVTLTNVVLSNNSAHGGNGYAGTPGGAGGNGGAGWGGALFVTGGSVTLTDDVLTNNAAVGGSGGQGGAGSIIGPRGQRNRGGAGGSGGNGAGGAVYVGGGAATFLNDQVTYNSAVGGYAGAGGSGSPPHGASGQLGRGDGGGLYISAPACLNAFTVANVINNSTATSRPDIDGPYTLY